MLNWDLFNWEDIFGVIKATEGLKRNQTRGLRTEMQEIATAKYSGNQFKYVGIQEDGKDYVDLNGFFWEDKSQNGMFLKTKSRTKKFVLKNFQSNKTEYNKTFDYILLKDTKNMSVGWAKWENVYKNIEIKDAVITSFVNYDDLNMIEFFVSPKNKNDFSITLNNLISEFV